MDYSEIQLRQTGIRKELAEALERKPGDYPEQRGPVGHRQAIRVGDPVLLLLAAQWRGGW